ncbi:DUF4272 domain-containing protein [Ohtaekwangia koreensis]|uniref:DUF4272 domain-containing protein n=1 Tax=Ohtaekwangia koreensis TaxID=688867 RepID=A0A1T5KNI8_9BACT|nr:DUF4272 domain-containing protein [Ohtaekwangia koreensis]SKC65336.1 protein of unknown function [Ohtaekwangia koreensis]
MSAIERKQHIENLLKELDVFLHDDLPPLEEDSNVTLRAPQEIARRIIILTYLNCAAEDDVLRKQIVQFLQAEGVWDAASQEEKMLFTKPILTDEDVAKIYWRSEAIWLLMWTINKVDTLDLPIEEVNIPAMFSLLPAFMTSANNFIDSAATKSVSEIIDQSDLTFRLNWAAREAHLNGSQDFKFNRGILYERYHAINWVTRMKNEWD